MIDARGARSVYVNDSSHDFFTRNMVVVLMEHRFPAVEMVVLDGVDEDGWDRFRVVTTLPARVFAFWQACHREALDDHGNFILKHLSERLDRALTTTTFAVTPWPAIELFPRLAKLQRLWKRVRAKLSL